MSDLRSISFNSLRTDNIINTTNMNKFIALAFFALCATVAHGQIISSLPLGLYPGDSSSSSSAAAAAAAASSSSASNGGLSRIASSHLISPLAPIAGPLPLNYPYGPYGPYGQQLVAPGWGPYGPIAPIPGVVQLV